MSSQKVSAGSIAVAPLFLFLVVVASQFYFGGLKGQKAESNRAMLDCLDVAYWILLFPLGWLILYIADLLLEGTRDSRIVFALVFASAANSFLIGFVVYCTHRFLRHLKFIRGSADKTGDT
jgi:hypothetical protein